MTANHDHVTGMTLFGCSNLIVSELFLGRAHSRRQVRPLPIRPDGVSD